MAAAIPWGWEGGSGSSERSDDAEPQEGEAAQTGNGGVAVWPLPFPSQAVDIHGCALTHVHAREREGREKMRERQRDAALLHAVAIRRRTDTHSILQQLLSVVDGTDYSRSPAASTAMTVAAGLRAEVRGWARSMF